MRSSGLFSLLLVLAVCTGLAPAAGAGFAPITEGERSFTQMPGHPEAPAAVLFRRGDFQMLDPARNEQSSVLTVQTRIKILTEEGKSLYGEVEIAHSRWVRLAELAGRTVLPDGREIPLGEDAIFERQSSRSRRISLTAAAFPAVEVGAILDYRFTVRFDSIYYLEPWTFQEEIPVLHSEITYHVPKEISARAWSRDPMQVGIRHETSRTGRGSDIRVWAEKLRPLPDEPWSFPAADLAARFMLVPTEYAGIQPLLDTWATTTELVEESAYSQARRNNTGAKRKARELAQKAAGRDDRAQAEILYRFVRDEIANDPWPGVLVDPTQGPDTVLSQGRGDAADKAFLLHSLLEAAKVKADLVWAANRWDGMIDSSIPSFSWFDRLLVRVTAGGEVHFLDPAEPGMPFGRFSPDYEGTQALVFDRRKPELITLPSTPFEGNQRQAAIRLAVDETGRLSGEGSLVWTGHHGAAQIAAARGGDGAVALWSEWLNERYGGFVVKDVTVEESPAEGQVDVRFKLEQPPEEVLGDEASVQPSRPLGPTQQLLTLPASRRQTPVMLDFGDRDSLELTLTWPEGWEVEARPADLSHTSEVGTFLSSCELDPAARSLRFTRRLDVRSASFLKRENYQQLQALFAAAEANDAQRVALVRR